MAPHEKLPRGWKLKLIRHGVLRQGQDWRVKE